MIKPKDDDIDEDMPDSQKEGGSDDEQRTPSTTTPNTAVSNDMSDVFDVDAGNGVGVTNIGETISEEEEEKYGDILKVYIIFFFLKF